MLEESTLYSDEQLMNIRKHTFSISKSFKISLNNFLHIISIENKFRDIKVQFLINT